MKPSLHSDDSCISQSNYNRLREQERGRSGSERETSLAPFSFYDLYERERGALLSYTGSSEMVVVMGDE